AKKEEDKEEVKEPRERKQSDTEGSTQSIQSPSRSVNKAGRSGPGSPMAHPSSSARCFVGDMDSDVGSPDGLWPEEVASPGFDMPSPTFKGQCRPSSPKDLPVEDSYTQSTQDEKAHFSYTMEVDAEPNMVNKNATPTNELQKEDQDLSRRHNPVDNSQQSR